MPVSDKITSDVVVVAMYDVTDKKLVAIFSSGSVCARYCFEKSNRAISKYIHSKIKNSKNVFARTVCFRSANLDQKKLLSNEEFVILDERYFRETVLTTYSSFKDYTRRQMAIESKTKLSNSKAMKQ